MAKQEKLLFVADAKLESGLNKCKVSDDLRSAFGKQGIHVSARAIVSVLKPGRKWSIKDPDQKRNFVVEKAAVASNTPDSGPVKSPLRQAQPFHLRILGT